MSAGSDRRASDPTDRGQVTVFDDVPPAVVVLSGLLIVGVTGYALLAPPSDGFTELAVTPGCGDEQPPLQNLSLVPGESNAFRVMVRNHGSHAATYSVVAQLRTVRSEGNATTVEHRQTIDEWVVRPGDGERNTRCVRVTPNTSDGDVHLAVLLYEGDAPADPRVSSADRYVLVEQRTGNESG